MKIEKQAQWQRPAAVFACLVWMAIMVQFSTQLWNSAHTKAALDSILSLGIFPDIAFSLDALNFGIRKAAHLTEYMVLTLMAFGAAVVGFQLSKTNALRLAMVCAVLFAISDE